MISDNNVSNSEPLQLSPGTSPLTRPSSLHTSEGDETPRKHELYIPGGDVVFEVENTLFRVHRYFFVRESPVFRDMLSMPPPSNGSLEGVSDENPIHLPQVTAIGFAHFLWVFYNPKYSIYDASLVVWKTILRLAHRWEFAEVIRLAFRELSRMYIPPVTRLALAEKYDAAPDWHAEALAELGNRAEPLTLEEGEELGLRTVVMIAELRESIYKRNDNNNNQPRMHSYSRNNQPRMLSYSRTEPRGPIRCITPPPPGIIYRPRTPSPPPIRIHSPQIHSPQIHAPHTPPHLPSVIELTPPMTSEELRFDRAFAEY